MNFIMIAGNLGADPEVRFTSSGLKVTTLRVACNSKKAGKDETVWWKVTIWGEQFDKLIPYFKKGHSIIVHGEVSKPEIFNDRDGKPQISLNIVASSLHFSPFGSGKTEKKEEAYAQPRGPSFGSSAPEHEFSYGRAPEESFNDEEIPF
ncbi:MAG: single-stranded DNA-binding protein [Chlamydiae bacterium]|nr:single-stranded DNA-binding protein [Chlamydiota bacterium]